MADRIILVRHGQTEWSRSGQHTSVTDLPLLAEGEQMADRLAPRLAVEDVALVLTSPLGRARETCRRAGFGDRAEVEPRLVEWEYGEYEGLTTPQIREERPDWWLWRDGCPGGEMPDAVGARADGILERLAELDGAALLFAHGHILRVLTARWLELPVEGGARFRLDAGTVSVLGHERETQVILSWNTQ
jgi:broad specificity phosphatase PhoE